MFKNIFVDNKTKTIHLWECYNGKHIKITDDLNPSFYIEDNSGAAVYTDIYGTPMIKKYSKNKFFEVKKFKEMGLKVCESDINEDIKYLQERYLDVDLKEDMSNIHIAYIDIEIAAEKEFPEPDDALYPINLISVKSSKTDTMYTFATEKLTRKCDGVEKYAYFETEIEMLTAFVNWWSNMMIDIVSGWNSVIFDMKYIINRIKRLTSDGLENKLSPIGHVKLVEKKTRKQDGSIEVQKSYSIAGLSQLDYLELYKKFTFVTQPSYSLNNIAMYELDEGKLDLDGTVNTIYKTDFDLFVEYNIQDVLLVEKFEEKLKLIELVITLCFEALIPFERVFSSISVLEGFILRVLHDRKMVMPDRKSEHHDWWVDEGYYNDNGYLQNVRFDDGDTTCKPFYIKGGHVQANRGFYKHLLSYDVTSEYPHEVMIYNISPETKVIKPTEEEKKHLIKSEINGVYYRRDIEGIFPSIIKRLFDDRKRFKDLMFERNAAGDKDGEKYYDSRQLIRKIQINSIYGVMGTQFFHFFDVDNARAVTRGGRVLIRFLAAETNKYFKAYWHKIYMRHFDEVENPRVLKNDLVCVIDTDSVTGDTLVKTEVGDIRIDDLYNSSDVVECRGVDNYIAKLKSPMNALSFNKDKNLNEFNNINYIMKHKVKKEMFKIKVGDKEVVMTCDHSLIVNRSGNIVDISPKDIKYGDKIMKLKCGLSFEWTDSFEVTSLGIQEIDVYDIEVEDNHNFFANDILVHNSNYVNLDEIKENYAKDMDFLDFADIMDNDVLTPFYDKILDIYHNKRGVKNLISYKREGVIGKQFVMAKKKYMTELYADEDKVFDPPVLKFKGVEVVRSSTPVFSRTRIKTVIKQLFDTLNKEELIKTLREEKKLFKKDKVENISSVSGINGYEKYAFPIEYYMKNGLQFKSHTPIHNRAAICYNYLVRKNNFPYMEIANGSKIKYVYIKSENIINSDVIGYIGKYPKEFEQFFEIDYDRQFEKTFMNVIQRMFIVLGWGKINLRGNKLSQFIKKKKKIGK